MPDLPTITSWLYDKELVKAWGPICVGVITVIGTFIVQFILMWHQRKQFDRQNEYNLKQLDLLKSKEERDEIFKRLNSFYGPLKELNRQSRILYDKYKIMLQKEKGKGGEPGFRTLIYLLDNNEFGEKSGAFFLQILEINQRVLNLIESTSGVVDKPELEDLLGRLGAHFRIIKLANDGILKSSSKGFEDVVFPLAIEGALESATLRLQDRLRVLNNVIESQPKKKKKLRINASTKYYNKNADSYALSILNYETNPPYELFLSRIPRGGRILDAGCGIGRDTRYFIEKGFLVISMDASSEMCRICSEYPHAYCLNIGFEEISFKEEFNGVWCCASLLHLPVEEAKIIMKKFATSLKVGGVIFLSLKVGTGQREIDGRYFQYYNEQSVKQLFQDEPRLSVLEGDIWRSKSRNGANSSEVDWLNLLLTRKI